jgi:1,4-dihydroxy-2-naphthoyl-CoA hydrolase
MLTPEEFNERGAGKLPGHLGLVVTEVGVGMLRAHFAIQPTHMAPNGYLHAGAIVTLADTAAGYGCVANLPDGASGFTTIELKSNHIGTALEGFVDCVATAVHMGSTTHVWDAEVRSRASGKVIAIFRCTQMILYRKLGM